MYVADKARGRGRTRFVEKLRLLKHVQAVRLPSAVAAGLLLFAVLKLAMTVFPGSDRMADLYLIGTSLVVAAVIMIPLKAADMVPGVRLMVRGIASLFTAFIILAPLSIPASDLESWGIPSWAFHEGRWLSLVVLVLSWSRPSLSLLIYAYVWLAKASYQIIVGLPVSQTDWFIVWEAGVFLVLTSWIIWCAQRWQYLDAQTGRRAQEWALLIVVAVHFANYFYSGLWKLALGPAPWTWLIENPTEILILNAWHTGILPLAFSEKVAAAAYMGAQQAPIMINAATLVGQLLAPVALMRIVWQRWLTAFFDVQHVVIFVLTGIFFWKWIVFNLLLILALGRIEEVQLRRTGARLLIAIMLCAPLVFHIVFLAWYDTRILNDVRLLAVTLEEQDIRLPTNTALFGSVTFTQSRAGSPFGGAAVTDSLGATWRAEEMRSFKACETPGVILSDSWRLGGDKPNLPALKKALSATFGFIAEQPYLAHDLSNVHYYAHHVFSNPTLYPELEGLALKDIVAVDVAVTARCTYLDGDRPGSIVLSQGRWRILDQKDMEQLR